LTILPWGTPELGLLEQWLQQTRNHRFCQKESSTGVLTEAKMKVFIFWSVQSELKWLPDGSAVKHGRRCPGKDHRIPWNMAGSPCTSGNGGIANSPSIKHWIVGEEAQGLNHTAFQ
jgi:hypothetical protein